MEQRGNAQNNNVQKDNVQRPSKGLHLDSSNIDTPKSSYKFALNAVIETELGDLSFISNEESNQPCSNIPVGFTPIGKEYIGEGRTVLFLVNADETVSEIGIHYDNCEYETHVNDAGSADRDKLNFKVSKQIDATYRLRKGCERTIYWTDDYNRPRYYNFDKPENFKNPDETWDSARFNLQKTYQSIPNFSDIEILDNGGILEPGSYNFAVQYVDEDLNPTEWITTSNIVKIYNDNTSKNFREINGSINSDTDYINFGKTSKAIKIVLSNLDFNFLYYRIAVIESNNGSGNVSRVVLTETIPTSKDFYIYTGNNGLTTIAEEEISQFSDIIHRANSIEQIENRLLLANTQGKQADFCSLQKYASRIKADCITKRVVLNNINDPGSPKNPIQDFGNTGYMPGEIYSFGISYIFEDGTTSPVYHIPGKNPNIANTVFTEGENVYPMSVDNQSENSVYEDNSNCGDSSYWGLDSEGEPLKSKFIRHHRFPLRTDLNLPLVTDVLASENPSEQLYYSLRLTVTGSLKIPYCDTELDPECVPTELPNFDIRVTYVVNGETFSFTESVDPDFYATNTTETYTVTLLQNSDFSSNNVFTDITMSITDVNGTFQAEVPVVLDTDYTSTQDDTYFDETVTDATYKLTIEEHIASVEDRIFTTDILGIMFSNIELPISEDTNGEKIIGYNIVRNERTEFNKTILDSAILTQTVYNSKYIAHGLLVPETERIQADVYGVIHPEHKFFNREYTNYDKIIQQGYYTVTQAKHGLVNYDDVYDGSAFVGGRKGHKANNDDGQSPDSSPTGNGYDGWSFNLITRDSIITYNTAKNFILEAATDIKERFYLDALGSKAINNEEKEVFNIAADNKVGMLQLKEGVTLTGTPILPYVLLYKKNSDPYSNFRILPYFKETSNPVYFPEGETVSSTSVYNGDSYISSMKYVNTMRWTERVARRVGRGSKYLKWIGGAIALFGVLLIATGILAAAGTIVLGIGIAIVGGGALLISSGIKQDNYEKAYAEAYNKGLRQTALDRWVDTFYNYRANVWDYGVQGFFGWPGSIGQHGPSDDTIQWLADSLSDVWFESSVNMNLRHKFKDDVTPTFIDSPSRIESGNNSSIYVREYHDVFWRSSNAQRYPVSSLEKHVCRKLLVFDEKRDDSRYYIGLPLGEYYSVNPDYLRKNRQKTYYHLPLEYDCCSTCKEDFPHRIHYSEQSFQEELTDNYATFLSNNYRDLEGETGEITNLFRIGTDLFAHTKEALWQVPRNYQERVTDQIISFIGTGSFFEIPPRKILDGDTGNSAGCQHKWSAIKTPSGYFFVAENQRTFYNFNGSKLTPISSTGLYSWFFNNISLETDSQYYKNNLKNYPFKDNPSNPIGTGFITSYDPQGERLLLTKKDFLVESLNSNYELCTNGDSVIIFQSINATISSYSNLGWDYLGIENCQLKFSKQVTKTRLETRREVDIEQNEDVEVEVEVSYLETEFLFIDGEVTSKPEINNSWTISYSLKSNSWISWHSYLPIFYFNTASKWFSWTPTEDNSVWQHNIKGNYQNYYGQQYAHMLEYVSLSSPIITRIWNHIRLQTEAKTLDEETEQYTDIRDVTYNKAILYNSRQCSGLLNLVVKDSVVNPQEYISQQIVNNNDNTSVIDRTEIDWLINDFRDIRVDYTKPIWNSKITSRQTEYYIDKVLNEPTLDINKDWTQLESFRDKYLSIRLIFDNFANIKLITNYSVENEQQALY